MYYAIVDYRGSVESTPGLSFGSLDDIKEDLLDNDRLLMEDLCEGMSKEEIEEDGGDVDDYYALLDATKPIYNVLKRYRVCISDCTTQVIGIVETYDDLKKLWEEFVSTREMLSEWILPDTIDGSMEMLRQIDSEIRMIGTNGFGSDYKYLKMHK